MSSRGTALQALIEIDRGARANEVVSRLLDQSQLEDRDRHLVTELVYGATRMRLACDWLVDRYTRGRIEPDVRAALRLGAYQLQWMRVPAHAAVSETVAEVKGPARSLVNAVLRRVAADDSKPRWPDLATRLSYPEWIVERLQKDLGVAEAEAALRTMNEPAAMSVRPDGYVQDPASQMLSAHLVDLLDGRLVLDLCAAPGGKATALSGAAEVVAGDIDESRAGLLKKNADRLGVALGVLVADGTAPPFRPGSADLVLVDAPCSGLGVLRRRPDARWRVRPADVDRLARLQRRLVQAAATLVRPGGLVAYSVCTLTKTETAAMDRWAAGAMPWLEPVRPPAGPWRSAGRGALLLPQAAGTDGMFLLVLRDNR